MLGRSVTSGSNLLKNVLNRETFLNWRPLICMLYLITQYYVALSLWCWNEVFLPVNDDYTTALFLNRCILNTLVCLRTENLQRFVLGKADCDRLYLLTAYLKRIAENVIVCNMQFHGLYLRYPLQFQLPTKLFKPSSKALKFKHFC